VSEELVITPAIPHNLKVYLSAATRQASDRNNSIILSTSNVEELSAQHLMLTVSRRLDSVFQFIAHATPLPGNFCAVNTENDYPAGDCRTPEEMLQYLRHLTIENLIKLEGGNEGKGGYAPTIRGWQTLEPRALVGGDPKVCFVAMWFDDSMEEIYETGIKPAIEIDCKLKAFRIKENPTNKAIIDSIFANIRRAGFMVADFTRHRKSVYYEAGFATGLGREVVSCCRADQVKRLTFDTRHLGHVTWKAAADLRKALADSIQANIIPKG
jgi:nucleoside 2-deoxyribosyltransferase